MTEDQIIQQILLNAFTDELEKVSAARGLGLSRGDVEKLAFRGLKMLPGEGAAAALKRRAAAAANARKPMARSRQAQFGRGATGEIDTSPNFMTPRERAMGRNVSGGPTRSAAPPQMQGDVLHY